MSNSAPSHQDCAIVVALPLMSCTHMAQYLQLGLLHRTKVDLAARADPRAVLGNFRHGLSGIFFDTLLWSLSQS